VKYKILGLLAVILFACALLSYHESVIIMRGDYLLTKWVGVTETNKNWFMLFFWLIVGGTIPYIVIKLFKKQRIKKSTGSKTLSNKNMKEKE
jgi:hypothetical protein